jgi:hypothetical protein
MAGSFQIPSPYGSWIIFLILVAGRAYCGAEHQDGFDKYVAGGFFYPANT